MAAKTILIQVTLDPFQQGQDTYVIPQQIIQLAPGDTVKEIAIIHADADVTNSELLQAVATVKDLEVLDKEGQALPAIEITPVDPII